MKIFKRPVSTYVKLLFGFALLTSVAGAANAEDLLEYGLGKSKVPLQSFKYLITQYTGECPGSSWSDFFSGYRLLINRDFAEKHNIPKPDKNVRVRLEVEETGAFTDREWSPKHQQENSSFYSSEKFNFTTGSKHANKHLVVDYSGKSTISVVFYSGKYGKGHTELANGTMAINLKQEKATQVRNRRYSDTIIECASNPSLKGSSITDENCPGIRQQVQYLQCPDGSGGSVGKQRIVQATLPGPKSTSEGGTVIIVPR